MEMSELDEGKGFYTATKYIHGLTNSFVELRNFNYDAIIYVIALSKAISDLTQQTT